MGGGSLRFPLRLNDGIREFRSVGAVVSLRWRGATWVGIVEMWSVCVLMLFLLEFDGYFFFFQQMCEFIGLFFDRKEIIFEVYTLVECRERLKISLEKLHGEGEG